MIREAYCSFEVAKLLKEKGFDEPCNSTYNAILSTHKVENVVFISEWGKLNQIKRPTQQMAMRWLREKRNIYIKIDFVTPDAFWAIVYKNGNTETVDNDNHNYDSPEDAYEAAIKYCLTNLI